MIIINLALDFWHFLLNNMSPLEIIAIIFGLLSVYFTVKENMWCWPTWIVMVALYIFIFYDVKLYSDMLLQIVFFFMQFYWWYFWLYWRDKRKEEKLEIITLSNKERLKWLVICLIWTFVLWFLMKKNTDASIPYIDALNACLSLIAQWFLSKKILENWWIWITVDVISIWMYAYKGLYLTTWLYVIFLILATLWLIKWLKAMRKDDLSSENLCPVTLDTDI